MRPGTRSVGPLQSPWPSDKLGSDLLDKAREAFLQAFQMTAGICVLAGASTGKVGRTLALAGIILPLLMIGWMKFT